MSASIVSRVEPPVVITSSTISARSPGTISKPRRRRICPPSRSVKIDLAPDEVGRCIDEVGDSDPAESFAWYEKNRMPRVEKVRSISAVNSLTPRTLPSQVVP